MEFSMLQVPFFSAFCVPLTSVKSRALVVNGPTLPLPFEILSTVHIECMYFTHFANRKIQYNKLCYEECEFELPP